MTNHSESKSDNTQHLSETRPKNGQPAPADAPTILPMALGAAGHPTSEAATLPPPSATAGYAAADDATLPRSAMGQTPLGGSSPQSVKYFGDYELLSEIARGGMGVVYKARQVNLNRLVALKMILAGQLASDEDVKRFYTEAEAAAALEHPGIVPIFEIGQHNDQHFFSMGFVDGGSLADKIKDGPLPSKEAATYTKKVAEAIAYAHSKGVIHRDLKPANILLDRNDEPKVTDFGLARRTESNSDLTRTGAVMGTPSYMPPEQAAGRTDQVGPLADVYSLGAILYCLLTGRPPFQASNPLDTLMQVMEREPVSATTLNPATPRDLETICHKCLRKDPAKRYASAQEFADDLGRWLSGEPIRARAVSSSERAWRWVKRHRTVSALIVSTAAAVLIGSAVSVWFGLESAREAARAAREAARALLSKREAEVSEKRAVEALLETQEARAQEARALKLAVDSEKIAKEAEEESRRSALEARKSEELATKNAIQATESERLAKEAEESAKASEAKAKESEANAIRSLARSDYLLALARWDENRVSEAKQFLNRVPKEYRFFEWRLAARVFEGDGLTLRGHKQRSVTSVSFSPDGKLIASGGVDKRIKLWDASTGVELRTLRGHQEPIWKLAFSPDGMRIASVSMMSNEVKVWDTATGKEIKTLMEPTDKPPIDGFVTFSPDGKRIAAGKSNGMIRLWDTETWTESQVLNGHGTNTDTVLFSPDGGTLVSADDFGEIKLWSLETGNEVATFRAADGGMPASPSFSPDGQSIVISCGSFFKTWSISTGKEIRRFSRLDDLGLEVRVATFTPDAANIVTGMSDGTISIWDTGTGKELKRFKGHLASVNSVSVSPDAREIISGSGRLGEFDQDGEMKIWDLTQVESEKVPIKKELYDMPGIMGSLAFSAHGKKVVSASPRGRDLWNAETGSIVLKLAPLGRNDYGTSRIFFSGDNQQVIALTNECIAHWDADTGARIKNTPITNLNILSLGPDGDRIAVRTMTDTIRILQSTGDKEIKPIKNGDIITPFYGASFNADGSILAALYSDGIRLWDPTTGEELKSITSNTFLFENFFFGVRLIFSPNGKRIVSLGRLSGIKLWDTENGRKNRSLKTNKLRNNEVSFSPDGTRIAAARFADTIYLWDSQTGDEIPTPSGLANSVRSVAFSPDGNRLAILDEDFTVKLWDLKLENRDTATELRRLAAPAPAWHQKQADSFESAGNLYAALFHRAWLWKLNPENPKRLEEFQATFKKYQTQSTADPALANRTLPTVVQELLATTDEAIKSAESK